jgi:hypothetical protein
MLGKLTEETLRIAPSMGRMTEETLAQLRRTDAIPEFAYNSYLIRPTPKQLRDSGQWTLEIHVAREHAGERRETMCHAANTFRTREEAMAWGVQFGADIIDGKVQGCSVEGL